MPGKSPSERVVTEGRTEATLGGVDSSEVVGGAARGKGALKESMEWGPDVAAEDGGGVAGDEGGSSTGAVSEAWWP